MEKPSTTEKTNMIDHGKVNTTSKQRAFTLKTGHSSLHKHNLQNQRNQMNQSVLPVAKRLHQKNIRRGIGISACLDKTENKQKDCSEHFGRI